MELKIRLTLTWDLLVSFILVLFLTIAPVCHQGRRWWRRCRPAVWGPGPQGGGVQGLTVEQPGASGWRSPGPHGGGARGLRVEESRASRWRSPGPQGGGVQGLTVEEPVASRWRSPHWLHLSVFSLSSTCISRETCLSHVPAALVSLIQPFSSCCELLLPTAMIQECTFIVLLPLNSMNVHRYMPELKIHSKCLWPNQQPATSEGMKAGGH